MQSVNLAGRFKETISLRIPAAREEIRILMPKKEVPESSKNNDAGNTKKTGSKSTNDVSKPNPEDGSQYEMTTISEPLYSRVEGITFSVVVARQATHLVHSYHDRYGLDDRKDAAFIVDVTPPQRITLWQWNRPIDLVQTWDIFGKVDAPSRNVFLQGFLANILRRFTCRISIRRNATNSLPQSGNIGTTIKTRLSNLEILKLALRILKTTRQIFCR